MGLIEMAWRLATSQSDRLARFLGKSPAEVRKAMEQGKQMLPEILKSSSPDSGAAILSRMGVDREFVDNAFQKFGRFGGKVGLNQSTIRNVVDNLGRAMDNQRQGGRQTGSKHSGSAFDAKKYPKL